MRKLKPFYPVAFRDWPRIKSGAKVPIYVLQSAQFLVQVFIEENDILRLTINSVKRRGNNWQDGITFDELQSIKNAIGYGDRLAVEIYPEDRELINDANMRHLWVLPERDRPSFAWVASGRAKI